MFHNDILLNIIFDAALTTLEGDLTPTKGTFCARATPTYRGWET